MLLSHVFFWTSWALVVYAYVIFPIILAAVARRVGNTSVQTARLDMPEESTLPRVAMVVAAYNEAAVLSEKLANTWKIDYPADRFSLIIGSDGSSDATKTVLEACSDPRLETHLFTERRGKISVLNDLMQRVSESETGEIEIVVMSDANTMFAPDAVRRLVRPFQDPKVGCVSGELGLEQNGGVSGEGLYWKYESWIKRNESKLGFLIGCNGGIFALRSCLYDPLPASIIVEDFVMTLRLLEKGWIVRFEPEARAVEPPCASSRAEMVRKIRIGAGNFQALTLTYRLLAWKYGWQSFAFWGHKVLRWLVPFFILTALVLNITLLKDPRYLLLLLLQLSGATVAIFSYHAQSGTALPRWTRPISYFYLMNYALLCGFFRFIFKTQRVTWERASR
jgi:cellulose synthase/poly-beta-1,6-N-acetylglucosamine synthase-like glycosyltransferase